MAKLSARNRIEICRMSKELDTPTSELITWERTIYTLMSDDTILVKRDVKFKPNPNLGETKPRAHSYGWKVHGKLSEKFTAAQWQTAYEAKGFVKTNQ